MIDKTDLCRTLNYNFKNTALLEQALTHSSALARGQQGGSYERLEFLGDRVLGLVIAEWLYETYPDAVEGILASQFGNIVGRESLAIVAQQLDLGKYIQRAKNDTQNARGEATMLADALEALFAAIYLDGEIEAVKPIIKSLFAAAVKDQASAPRDAKTVLQEWAQARGYKLPAYTLIARTGPSHAPEFEVEVTVQNMEPIRATGASKQEAEKAAAALLFAQISKD